MVDSIILKLHHGGTFSKESRDFYAGGEISEFELDLDKLSIFEISGYANDIGYHSVDFFTVKDPGGQGYKDVTSDKDLLSLCRVLKSGDRLDVYIEHHISSPNLGGNYPAIEYSNVSGEIPVVTVGSNAIESGGLQWAIVENNFEGGSVHINHIEVEDSGVENNKRDEVIVADVNLEQEGFSEDTESSETKTDTSDSGSNATELEDEGNDVDE